MSKAELKLKGCTHLISVKGYSDPIYIFGELELNSELRDLSLRGLDVLDIFEL